VVDAWPTTPGPSSTRRGAIYIAAVRFERYPFMKTAELRSAPAPAGGTPALRPTADRADGRAEALKVCVTIHSNVNQRGPVRPHRFAQLAP